jgi:ABC-type dipeptide/oligopeptide/nickel transport system permease component
MRLGRYIARRLLVLIPQLFAISLVTFLLIRLIPGDPSYSIAGGLATEKSIKAIRARLGLDQPLPVQYLVYLRNLSQGDFGDSWVAGRPVKDDLVQRVPATLELITISFILAVVVAVPMGVLLAMRGGGRAERGVMVYGLLAGAVPDFWLALLLAYVFYFQLRWLPAPLGQIDLFVHPPPRITGMLLVDSIVAGNGAALRSHLAHLVLPVLTLSVLYAAPVLKMTRSSMQSVLGSGFIRYGGAAGLPRMVLMRYALRNALSPVVTLVGVLYSILLGGAVLVEQVYGWGGIGQYAVQSILNSDYLAIQGFVLIAGAFALLVYLAVDIIHIVVDPRIQH